MKLHHIGIKTNNIDKALPVYLSLGFSQGPFIIDSIQNNRIVFLKNPSSGECLELIEPLNHNSTLAHSPLGLHHICYDLSNYLDFDLDTFFSIGKKIYGPLTAPALDNCPVAFFVLPTGVVIEYILPPTLASNFQCMAES